MIDTHIFHGGNLASRGVMWDARIWVRDLANDLSSVVHAKHIGLVVEAIWAFLNMHAAVGASRRGGDPGQLGHVEPHGTLGHLMFLIVQKSAAREDKQAGILVPVGRRV